MKLNLILRIGLALSLLFSLIFQNNIMVLILVLFVIGTGMIDVYEKPSKIRALFYIVLLILFLIIWF